MGPPRTFRYGVLLTATLGWLALIVSPAWAAWAGWAGGDAAYRLLAPVCHQMPERSFIWAGAPLAVCHRCFGVYSGFAVGLLLWPRFPRLADLTLARSRIFWAPLLLMALDVALPNHAWDRVATGLLVGIPAALFVWAAAEELSLRSLRLFGAPAAGAPPEHPADSLTAAGQRSLR